jgi:succinate dehydrogenase / fumarate reductase iron-sulfur subunit
MAGVDPGVAAASGRGGLELEHVEDTGETVTLRLFRGDASGGEYKEYTVAKAPGMVVLDVVHRIQATEAPDLACRWNCKAGKCGSCSAEVNGVPRLMCMTRLSDLPQDSGVAGAVGAGDTAKAGGSQRIHVAPMKAFPLVKDLVTDVSWNYRVNAKIQPFTPKPLSKEERARGELRMAQRDVDRVQEFRKCIECFLCQDVCHVLRTHQKHDEFAGPRLMVRYASLEMHPKDNADRLDHLWKEGGIGMCNITKCCTEVCPEHITITDNAIIPLKERVVTRRFDPIAWVWRKITGRK